MCMNFWQGHIDTIAISALNIQVSNFILQSSLFMHYAKSEVFIELIKKIKRSVSIPLDCFSLVTICSTLQIE